MCKMHRFHDTPFLLVGIDSRETLRQSVHSDKDEQCSLV